MSLVPIIYDLARGIDNYGNRTLFDDFGFGLYPHEIFESPRLPRNLFDPRLLQLQYPFEQLNHLASLRDNKEKMTIGKDGFQVSVNVNQFKPNELTVKTTDNYVVVEGKHEEREDDHGFIQRHFVRKYWLPNGYNPNELVSTISSDGVLTIKAPPPPKSIEGKERVVKIQETGVVHSSIKDKAEPLAIKNAL